MSSSINTYLKDLSYSYYLKKDSYENNSLKTSLSNLYSNIDVDLQYLVNSKLVFGSYDRDTLLKRTLDSKSDIDVMVIFNHTEYERTPDTYRAWLKNFADKRYKDRYGSDVVKSFPTVTIKLNNINFDLVPTKSETSYLYGQRYYIPSSSNTWIETNPKDVKDNLTEANTRYNSIVKPIIRLIKAWNAKVGHPFDSYELELAITNMNFYNDNYESAFFYCVGQLNTKWDATQTQKDKLTSLKYNVSKVRDSLAIYDISRAKEWLHRVLPY